MGEPDVPIGLGSVRSQTSPIGTSGASEAQKINTAIQELSAKVDLMRDRQQAIEREALELTRQIELKQADLRKAELDVQHTTGAVAARLGESL